MNKEYFSWTIIDEKNAIKKCDLSFFKYASTGIPVAVRSFFDAEDMFSGERKEIEIICNEQKFKAFVYVVADRTKLTWNNDLKIEFDRYSNQEGNDCFFYKVTRNLYIIDLKNTFDASNKREHDYSYISDERLFEMALEQGNEVIQARKQSVNIIRRGNWISEYVKRNAKGICQLCGKEAPFNKKNGEPYLESHHIVWLSRGGSDTVDNAVALCPNCHKKMHILDREEDKLYLQQFVINKYNINKR